VLRGNDVISDVIKKCRLQTKTDILQKLFKRKNMTLQVICRKSKLAETGVIVDLIFFGKIDKLGSVW